MSASNVMRADGGLEPVPAGGERGTARPRVNRRALRELLVSTRQSCTALNGSAGVYDGETCCRPTRKTVLTLLTSTQIVCAYVASRRLSIYFPAFPVLGGVNQFDAQTDANTRSNCSFHDMTSVCCPTMEPPVCLLSDNGTARNSRLTQASNVNEPLLN